MLIIKGGWFSDFFQKSKIIKRCNCKLLVLKEEKEKMMGCFVKYLYKVMIKK